MKTTIKYLITVISALGLSIQSAQALTPDNRLRLEAEFASLGTVAYYLMAPLGAPELGAALIDKGATDYSLVVLQVTENGKVDTLLSEAFPKAADNTHPFTFLYHGRHLLTYKARSWQDKGGNPRLRGEMTVRDIGDKGDLSVLFRIPDIVDLNFGSDGVRSERNMLWQPTDHFLNSGGKLPLKSEFQRLAFDPITREYRLFHHLAAMPDALKDEAANLNNRAIIYYDRGEIHKASRLLSEAWTSVVFNPVTIQQNQDMVKGEMDDLEKQCSVDDDSRVDDALLYFWLGDWDSCLRIMSAREARHGLSDYDLAITGVTYAYLQRWPEADDISRELDHRQAPFLADYFSELARIASFQNFKDSFEVEGNYLKLIAITDDSHPGLVAGKARLLRRQSEFSQAQEELEQYLWLPGLNGYNLTPAIYELAGIYHSQSDSEGLRRLETLALDGPVTDLSAYISVVDHRDLSSSLIDVEPQDREGISMPDLLEQITVTK